MTTLLNTYTPVSIGIKYLDDVTSVGVNRRAEGLNRLGIIRGFFVAPAAGGGLAVDIFADSDRGDHAALIPLGTEEVSVHVTLAHSTVDLTSYADSRAHIVLQLTKTPSTTEATLLAVTDAEYAALTSRTFLTLATVDVPASGDVDTTHIKYFNVEWCCGATPGTGGVSVLELIDEPIANALPYGEEFTPAGTDGGAGTTNFPIATGRTRWGVYKGGGNGRAESTDNYRGMVSHILLGETESPIYQYSMPWSPPGLFATPGVKLIIEVDAQWVATVSGTLHVTAHYREDTLSETKTFAFNPGDPRTVVEAFFDIQETSNAMDVSGISLQWVADSSVVVDPEEDAWLWGIRGRALRPLNSSYDVGTVHGASAGRATNAAVWLGTDQGYQALVGFGPQEQQYIGTLHDYAMVAAARYFLPAIADRQAGPSMVVAGGSAAPETVWRRLRGGSNLMNDGSGHLMLVDGMGIDESRTPQAYLADATPPWRPSAMYLDASKRLSPLRLRRKSAAASASSYWGNADMYDVGLGTRSYDLVVAPSGSDRDTGDYVGTNLNEILNYTLTDLPSGPLRIFLMPGSYTAAESAEGVFGSRSVTFHAVPGSATTLTLTMATDASPVVGAGQTWELHHLNLTISNQAAFGTVLGSMHLFFSVVRATTLFISDEDVVAQNTVFDGASKITGDSTTKGSSTRSRFTDCRFEMTTFVTSDYALEILSAGSYTGEGAVFERCVAYSDNYAPMYVNNACLLLSFTAVAGSGCDASRNAFEIGAGEGYQLTVIDERTVCSSRSFRILGNPRLYLTEVTSHLGAAEVMELDLQNGARVCGLEINCRIDGSAYYSYAIDIGTSAGSFIDDVHLHMRYDSSTDHGKCPAYFTLSGDGRINSLYVHHDDDTRSPEATDLSSNHTRANITASNVGEVHLYDVPASETNTNPGTEYYRLLAISTAARVEKVVLYNTAQVTTNPDRMPSCLVRVEASLTTGVSAQVRELRCSNMAVNGPAAVDMTAATALTGIGTRFSQNGAKVYLHSILNYWGGVLSDGGYAIASYGRLDSLHAEGCARCRISAAGSAYIGIKSTAMTQAGGSYVEVVGGDVGSLVVRGEGPGASKAAVVVLGIESGNAIRFGHVGSLDIELEGPTGMAFTASPLIIGNSVIGSVRLVLSEAAFATKNMDLVTLQQHVNIASFMYSIHRQDAVDATNISTFPNMPRLKFFTSSTHQHANIGCLLSYDNEIGDASAHYLGLVPAVSGTGSAWIGIQHLSAPTVGGSPISRQYNVNGTSPPAVTTIS